MNTTDSYARIYQFFSSKQLYILLSSLKLWTSLSNDKTLVNLTVTHYKSAFFTVILDGAYT